MGLISRVSSRTYRHNNTHHLPRVHRYIYPKMLRRVFRQLSTSVQQNARYGGRHTAVLIPGDGIGHEMSEHLKNCFRIIQAPVDFEVIEMKGDNYDEQQIQYALTAVKRSGACIKGNIHTSLEEPGKARNLRMRTELDLYANVIHAKSFDGVNTRHKDVDIYLVRENTEGEYSGMEHESVPGVVESLKIISRAKCERIARFAFEFAVTHDRKKVTAVHKANIMKQADGLFLRTCREVSQDYPSIEFNDMIVDNTCMQLVSNPWQFDVMVLPNLYGSVVSNICCGIVGGPGIAAGSNYGDETAVFEMATRNTGVSIEGQNIANPIAFLMAGCKMLEYYKLQEHADLIRGACNYTLNDAKVHTPDLRGPAHTSDVIHCVTNYLKTKVQEEKHKIFQQEE